MNRSPIQYHGYCGGAKAVQYGANTALIHGIQLCMHYSQFKELEMKGKQVNYPITIIAVLMQFSFKCNFYNQQIGVVRVNHNIKFGIQLEILRIIIIPLACSIASY